MESSLGKIIKIISKQLRIAESEITAQASIMEDVGADSLDLVEIVMAIEEEFDVAILDSEITDMKTVGDIAKYVDGKRK